MIRRRPIWTRSKRRCMRRTNRSFSSPAERTKVLLSNRFAPLVRQKARAVILIGEMAQRIARIGKARCQCEIADSLADAVERAHAMAQAGRDRSLFPGNFLLRHVQELRRSRRSISRPRPRPTRDKDENAQVISTQKTARHARRGVPSPMRRNGLRRNVGAEHEVVARAADCSRSARRRRRRHHRFQRDQDAPGRIAGTTVDEERECENGRCIHSKFRAGNSETDRDREPRRRKTKALGGCQRRAEDGQSEARGEKFGDRFRKNLRCCERRQSGDDRAQIQGLLR